MREVAGSNPGRINTQDLKVPTHYSIKLRDVVPGVVAVLFSPADVAVMSLKRLTVYVAT